MKTVSVWTLLVVAVVSIAGFFAGVLYERRSEERRRHDAFLERCKAPLCEVWWRHGQRPSPTLDLDLPTLDMDLPPLDMGPKRTTCRETLLGELECTTW